MQHRHLNHSELTLAAIDDIIERGKLADWIELRNAVQEQPELGEKILKICDIRCEQVNAQRHHFWKHYVRRLPT